MEKPIMLFNLLGHKKGTNYAYSVYDKAGIAPTILTMTGGGRQPMIVEVEDEQTSDKTDAGVSEQGR